MKPERWLPVVGFEEAYEVSDLGRVRTLARIARRSNGRPYPVKAHIRKTPLVREHASLFLKINGTKKFFYVHYLVARAFIGPRPIGKEVAHWDGDGTNAALSNLRYATPTENDADKLRHGTRPNGERNGAAKLTERDVLEIRLRSAAGEKGSDLAEEFYISSSSMARIRLRHSWRHI